MMREPRVAAPVNRPGLQQVRRLQAEFVLPGELKPPAPRHMMRKLGLAVFQEPGQRHEARMWVGLTDPQVSDHDRWLYTAIPYSAGWTRCMRLLWDCDQDLPDHTFEQPYTTLLELLNQLETLHADLSNHFADGQPPRDIAWLTAQRFTFGHTDPFFVARMPRGINWAETHDLRFHNAAWRLAHEAREMPYELLLRMHGLSPLLEAGGIDTEPHYSGAEWARLLNLNT